MEDAKAVADAMRFGQDRPAVAGTYTEDAAGVYHTRLGHEATEEFRNVAAVWQAQCKSVATVLDGERWRAIGKRDIDTTLGQLQVLPERKLRLRDTGVPAHGLGAHDALPRVRERPRRLRPRAFPGRL